jgi:2-oxoisovalerate dehydrogenase E2 component (dihydrolipoyl transacylase)
MKRNQRLTGRYSHTLNLTPILPYLRALTPSPPPKQSYLANDIPSNLVRNPLPLEDGDKTTILSFLIKGLLLAMEHHPIMRSRVKQAKNGEGERWLEVGRDGVVGVAVSGE